MVGQAIKRSCPEGGARPGLVKSAKGGNPAGERISERVFPVALALARVRFLPGGSRFGGQSGEAGVRLSACGVEWTRRNGTRTEAALIKH